MCRKYIFVRCVCVCMSRARQFIHFYVFGGWSKMPHIHISILSTLCLCIEKRVKGKYFNAALCNTHTNTRARTHIHPMFGSSLIYSFTISAFSVNRARFDRSLFEFLIWVHCTHSKYCLESRFFLLCNAHKIKRNLVDHGIKSCDSLYDT